MNSGAGEKVVPSIACVCSGDADEMGFAQGSALRSRIVELHGRMRQFDAFTLEQPWWLPYELFLRLAENKAIHALVPALHGSNPGMLSRVKGDPPGGGPAVTQPLLDECHGVCAELSRGAHGACVGGRLFGPGSARATVQKR